MNQPDGLGSLVAYLVFTFVLVITPGSTTAVVVRNTLAGGRAAGLASAAGAALGNSTHAIAAGLGLALLFARWPPAMTALKLGGAGYLAWLGATSLVRAIREVDGGLRMPRERGPRPAGDRAASFRQGLTVNLLNPAIATFYLVVVPSFVRGGAPRAMFAALAAVHVTMALVVHSGWAVALDAIASIFRPPLARRLLEMATGAALLGLAYRVWAG